jgi:hypothetical protein
VDSAAPVQAREHLAFLLALVSGTAETNRP